MKLFLIFTFGLLFSGDNEALKVTEDLKSHWMILSEGKFKKFDGGKTNVVHLKMNLVNSHGYLQLQSQRNLYLFINSLLIAKGKFFKLDTDSLSKKYSSAIFFSIYQKEGINDLSTVQLKLIPVNQFANPLRKNNSFSNFILIAIILLIGFFTALLRTNPQLTLDYLDIAKLFSLRDRDENQIALRITSSVNFLFYTFASLLTSIALLIAAHYSQQGLSILANSERLSEAQYFVSWFLIAIVVVILLMIKLGIAKSISLLFGWKDLAGLQFFHFVRVLVLTLFFIGLIGVFCFSFGINANYYFFIKISCVILSVGAGLLYFKLLAKAQFSSFHLFSYLCATEFIPLMILIKVFLN